jgi:hypothetical protein
MAAQSVGEHQRRPRAAPGPPSTTSIRDVRTSRARYRSRRNDRRSLTWSAAIRPMLNKQSEAQPDSGLEQTVRPLRCNARRLHPQPCLAQSKTP